MSGYTKLFNSILASTIWRSSDKTRLVWITMMAMADRYGNVEASIPGLADLAHVAIPDCQLALTELASPDEFSRSKESEGRRIELIDGGWHLINHDKYRKKMGADERREYLKLKQREYRQKARQQSSTTVNNVSDTDTRLTHTEAEAYTEDRSLDSTNKLDRRAIPSTTSNGHGRAQPAAGHQKTSIIGRNPHISHAACDDSLSYCVPAAVHHKLADLLAPKHAGNREAAKAALHLWYPTVWHAIPSGTIMGDGFKFWQNHFDAAFASAPASKQSRINVAELTEQVRADMKAAGEL